MDGFLKALGFETKPDFKEKIPDTLSTDCFNVHNTFKHGFSSHPLCLGYDCVQQLLAIGTELGAVLLLGKPGLEKHIQHPDNIAVTHLEFITNKGLLVTVCDNRALYLWNIRDKEPFIIHTLEFNSEKPTAISSVFGSQWIYVGTEAGNVHLLNLHTFKISGFSISWNNAVELSCRHKPGYVISVQEHPLDQGKVLIAFSGGKCVLYDTKASSEAPAPSQKEGRVEPHRRFNYDPGSDHILTCVSWLGNGRNFACSYSDGTIVIWNPKSDAKPERIFPLHDKNPTAFKPIYKMQQVHTESDPWILASGGYPEGNNAAPRTLTVIRGKAKPKILSTDTTILDFICLPSSPYASDCQRPFALVILTKNELTVHELEEPRLSRYPPHSFPYALDIHLPGVTFLHHTANCPDELIASLHSVKSKLMKPSIKPWPLKGGKWGQEVPHTSTDLIVTGHVDGSLRLWYSSSVILQPFFTMSTSQFFKMQYQPSPASSPRKKKPVKASPSDSQTAGSADQPDQHISPPVLATKSASLSVIPPQNLGPTKVTTPPARPPPPKGAPPVLKTQASCPEGAMRRAVPPPEPPSSVTVTPAEDASKYPATGQQQGASALETPDGLDVEKKDYSKRKSFFKKKKSTLSTESPHGSREPSPLPDDPTGSTGIEKKKSPQLLKKSFRKVAKVVKIGRSISRDKDKRSHHSIDEVDGEMTSSQKSSTPGLESSREEVISESKETSELSALPKRPNNIPLKEPSKDTATTAGSTSLAAQTPHTSQAPGAEVGEQPTLDSHTPSPETKRRPLRLTDSIARLPEQPSPSCPVEDFFPVNNINMCAVGLWMCVSNKGGAVMAFNFQMSEQKTPPQALDINFNEDTVFNQYSPVSSRTRKDKPLDIGQFVFASQNRDSHPGFQLGQVCTCSHYTKRKKSGKKEPAKVFATITVMKYSVDLNLLVIGTDLGFAVVNTDTNTCLYVLSALTSILYLSDPSKYTRAMRKESENYANSRSPRALVRRHSTQRALTVAADRLARGSEPQLDQPGPSQGDFNDKEMTISESQCSVTALELVQLQLDKQGAPTLVLWAGLASGHLVAYGVNVTSREGSKEKRKIDLIPTKFIQETKSPLVKVYFLNEWGDCQVIPYQLKRTNLSGSPGEHPSPRAQPTTLEHYAIVVSEDRIRSFSFPGGQRIESCALPLPDGGAVLKSEYFTCKDLPCLLSLASNKTIFIHSLPGLRELLHIQMNALTDTRAICTFSVSGRGQGIFMSSESEIQRLSIVKDDKLNLPACLPNAYSELPDPDPYHGGVGKRLLDAIFTSGVTTIDREQLFGEAARKPIGNLYKLDGKTSTAYSGKKDRDREEQRRQKTEGASGEGKTGVAGQMDRNVQALQERKEKLSAIEQRTAEVAEQASDFASLAKRLRQKYEK